MRRKEASTFLTGLFAGACLLAVFSGVAFAKPAITNLQVSPDPFTAEGGQKLTIAAQLSERAHVIVRVVGARVVMEDSKTATPGGIQFSWDGLTPNGDPARNGAYAIVVRAENASGERKAEAKVTLQKNNPIAPLDPGSLRSELLATGAVTADKLTANAVTAGKLAANSITAEKIAAKAVQADAIAAGAVGSSAIATGAVVTGKIAADAVGASELASGAVGSTEIASGAVTASDIASDAIGANDIAGDAIGASEIATDAVTADEIAADAIGASEIAAGAIGASEIATDAVGRDEIAADAISADKISNDEVGNSEVTTSAVQSDEVADGSLLAVDIGVLSGLVSINPGSIAAGTCSVEQSAADSVANIVVGDWSFVDPPSTLNAGLVAGPVLQTATNRLSVRLCNITAAPIDDGAGDWGYVITR